MVKSRATKIPPRLRLAPEWQPPRDPGTGELRAIGSRLWTFTEKIASSRREGKNRRDGATVSTRVTRLTDMLGRKLFEQALGGAAAAPGGQGPAGGGGAGAGLTYPTLNSEDALALARSMKAGKRRRALEKRARL